MGILILGLLVGTVCGIAMGLRRGKSLQNFVSEERAYKIISRHETGTVIEVTFADILKEKNNGSPFLVTVIIEKKEHGEIIFVPAPPEYSSEKEKVRGTGPAFAL